MKKIEGYVSTQELNWWIKTPIENNGGTPIILEIWKDKKDMRDCLKGIHVKKVSVNLIQKNE